MSNHVIYDRIWKSKKLAECSRNAALAYPWVYLVADDYGRFEMIPRQVWADVFGSREDITPKDVTAWLNEYVKVGLLEVYDVGDKRIAVWWKFVGPPPSKRRPSLLPDRNGVVDTEGLKARSRFHSGTGEVPNRSGSGSYETGTANDKQEAGSRNGAAARQPTWISEACDDWNARYGPGSAAGGKIAGGLKRVVSAMAESLVEPEYDAWAGSIRPAWRRYLGQTSHPSPSAANFAEHFSDWMVPTSSATKTVMPMAPVPAMGKQVKALSESSRLFLEAHGVGPGDVRSADEPVEGAAIARRLRG